MFKKKGIQIYDFKLKMLQLEFNWHILKYNFKI